MFVRVIIWNLYLDQHKLILEECKDGKSYSEVLRRIIDYGKENNLDLSFRASSKRSSRELHKSNFGITVEQYEWFTNNFPSRMKSQGLRYNIDHYFKTNKKEDV